jgi:AraC-like DNA-binding protein
MKNIHKNSSVKKPPDIPAGQDHIRNKINEQLIPGWKEEVKQSLLISANQENLLKRFITIAGDHVSDKHFGIKELLMEMHTSRTQLHRKLKASTGQSTNELFRSIRMEKALLLLQSTKIPVAEIAGLVGFTSPSYFSKIFGEHFGFLPREVRDKLDNH